MNFRVREVSFQEADRRYAELTRQRDEGSISDEEFDAQRRQLMVRDDEGRWWAKIGKSGEWHYRDGGAWVRGTPPGYREAISKSRPDSLPSQPPSSLPPDDVQNGEDGRRKREIDFREADRRYAEAKRQLDAGSISEEEFDAQRLRLRVRDDEGRWWAKSRKSGEWNYYDGSAWVRGTPPGYRPTPAPLAESAPDPQPRLDQGERMPLSRATLPGSALIQDRNIGKQRRWIVAAILGLMVASLAGIGGLVATAPAYVLVEGDTGELSVEVPSEWKEHITGGSEPEGEKGRTWSSFLGEHAGPSIAAINDLDSWRTGARPHKGAYLVASSKLAQEHTDDELVASGPNDYSASCEVGARRGFDRPPYSGVMQEWNNCGGESDHTALTLAAAPEDRECVVLLQIGGYLQGDEVDVQHLLDTFEADCGSIS